MSNQPNPAMPRNEQQPASSAEPPDLYRIEQVAELTGLTKRTLRYYEERGLLDPPTRTEGNYRLYTAADVDHIRRVKRIRELLGASLAEIKEMVEGEEARQSFRDEWALNPDPATRVALLERGAAVVDRQLAVVRAKMADLRELEETLIYKQRRYKERRDDLAAQTAPPASSSADSFAQ
jgi:MerR family transcriptional regulator, repressor of the yfmOP operon